MAFNTLQYLKEGKVDFVYSLTTYDENNLIKNIREDPDKINIIKGFLIKLKDQYNNFCLNVIYDIEEFRKDALELLEKSGCIFIDPEKLENILRKTSWARKYVLDNLDDIILNYDRSIYVIFDYVFQNFEKNKDFVDKLYLHKNLHIRYLFMRYLVKNHSELINEIYDDITKYLTSYTHQEFEQMSFLPDLMDINDISELAVLCLKSNNRELWLKLKEYILNNYKENSLAKLLLENRYYSQYKLLFDEFLVNPDVFFETSIEYRFSIYDRYEKYISDELIQEFLRKIQIFKIKGEFDYKLYNIYYHGLGKKLEELVDKYLSISKDKSYNHIKSGSMSSCYRVGSYAFKLCNQKWSYEDVLCPNIYLILKNIEEYFCRNEYGIVTAGIEIQKFLTKEATGIDEKYFEKFKEELDSLGFIYTDTLINGTCGDNCMLLDSYKDADCHNPEELPDWFKEVPLVLIDRDRVYKKGTLYKQLFGGY